MKSGMAILYKIFHDSIKTVFDMSHIVMVHFKNYPYACKNDSNDVIWYQRYTYIEVAFSTNFRHIEMSPFKLNVPLYAQILNMILLYLSNLAQLSMDNK